MREVHIKLLWFEVKFNVIDHTWILASARQLRCNLYWLGDQPLSTPRFVDRESVCSETCSQSASSLELGGSSGIPELGGSRLYALDLEFGASRPGFLQ